MFTYSHVNTPLSQSEHPYYLSFFIKFITSRWLKQRKQSILNNEPTAVTLTIVHETKKTNKLYYARNDPTILVTLVGTVVMFSALPMLVFASLHHRAWNSTLIGKWTHLFVEIRVLHGVTLPYHSAGIFIWKGFNTTCQTEKKIYSQPLQASIWSSIIASLTGWLPLESCSLQLRSLDLSWEVI